MGKEIERKFLVAGDAWKRGRRGVSCRQGYLCTRGEATVRVRIMGHGAMLTIKGPTAGATRSEFEYEIPVADAGRLLGMCEGPLIEKTRYRIAHRGLTWEVDEFHGANAGLVVAECELEAEDQPIDRPDWVAEEVTGDPRYYNVNLAAAPYATWREQER